ncbi:MAG TPA: hypothetical protein VKD90_10940, partial [Gemmataceae bacterium]|nr:hypothetical protein [Gemmataceae bacterium]
MRPLTMAALLVAAAAYAQDKPADKAKFAGPTESGFLLPNGWHLTPVGQHVVTTDLPLNILPLKDGRHALVATSGFNRHDLMVIGISGSEPKVVTTDSVRQSWYGLAMDKAESKVWWSGGGFGRLHTFDLAGVKLVRTSKPEPEPKKDAPRPKEKEDPTPPRPFNSGLCLDEERGVLYSLLINSGELAAISLKDGAVQTAKIGG